MEIILLTPDYLKTNETEIVNRLFEAGLERLHLRKSAFNLQQYRNYINEIDSRFHSKIVMHGAGFELYKEYSLAGIHLNSLERNSNDIQSQVYFVPRNKISSSFHEWQEICSENYEYGYAFISPVFDSISKTDYVAAVDLRGLEQTKKHFETKNKKCPGIYALGGVDIPHIHILKQYNFNGAVVYGAIWKSNDPIYVMKGLLQVAK